MDKFDIAKQIKNLKGDQNQNMNSINNKKLVTDNSSRSNSIQGRKLSFCDPQITVSQNTIENNDKVNMTQRERDTFQRLSAAGIPIAVLSSITNTQSQQQENFTILKTKSTQNSIKKSPLKERNSMLPDSTAYQNYSQKSGSMYNLKGNMINRKNFNNDSSAGGGGGNMQTSFLLTFNIDKNSSDEKDHKHNHESDYKFNQNHNKSKNKENNHNMPINQDNQKQDKIKGTQKSQKPANENRIKKLEEEGEKIKQKFLRQQQQSSSVKKIKQTSTFENRRFSSPSPQQLEENDNQRHSYHEFYKHSNGRQSENPHKFLRATSDEKRSSHNKIIKENLKKHGQKQQKEFQKIVLNEIQKSMKKQQIKIKNKQIRERNQQHISLKVNQNQKPQKHQQNLISQNKILDEGVGLRMKSKSPIKQFNEFKNRDMPLKVLVANEDPKKKKHDIGLEIFELKKELGMFGEDKQQVSIDKILTERSKKKQIQKIQKEQLKQQQEQADIINKRKYQENPQLQKLIHKQHKKRVKQQKQEKISQLINQQRILSNLKTLNEITEQKRILRKKEIQQKGQNFKTVQEQDLTIMANKKQKHEIKNFVQDQRQSYIDQNRSVSQQRKRPRSKNERNTPNILKKNLKIKQNYSKIISSGAVSSRPSLENHNSKIRINIPKTKILYTYVSQDNLHQSHQQSYQQQQNIQGRQSIEKKKSSKSKQRLIQKIMKQFKIQQRNQESNRQQQFSRSKSQNKKSKKKLKYHNHIISIETPQPQKLLFQNQSINLNDDSNIISKSRESTPQKYQNQIIHQHSQLQIQNQSNDVINNISFQSDNVVIDDQLMIFCIQTTAASIIQKNFRKHLQRKKKNKEQESINFQKQMYEEYQKGFEFNKNNEQNNNNHLSDSIKFENRLLPVNEAIKHEENKKKAPKHTFSFGNYDEHHLNQNAPGQDSSSIKDPYKINNLQSVNQDSSFRLDSSPVDDQPAGFYNQSFASDVKHQLESRLQSMKDRDSFLIMEEEIKQEEKQEDNQDYEKILNINDKFKYALRNLADRQKHTNIYDQIKNSQSKKQTNLSKLKDSDKKREQAQQQQQQQQISKFQHQNQSQLSELQLELQQIYEARKQQQAQQQQQHNLNNDVYIINESISSQDQYYNKRENHFSIESLQNEINLINGEGKVNHLELSRVSMDSDSESVQQELLSNDLQSEKPEQIIVNKQDYYLQKQNDSVLSSILASKGEQTDKIMLNSPINTNEELIEAAVNESNNLNNEDSIIINDSNTQSKVDQQKALKGSSKNEDEVFEQFSKEDIKLENFITQPIFDYQQKNLRESYRNIEIDNVDDSSSNDSKRQAKTERKDSIEEEDKLDIRDLENPFSHQSSNQQDSRKPILRLMFGDEKFLLNLDYDGSPRDGSAPSTQRYQMSENPYFLATNASIFDRNPFQEFTTNKLHDILQGKNSIELNQMKDEALKFQEKLEKGFINRLEKQEELSPKSSQRRKYELERWVSSERKKTNKKSDDNKPINFCDLEQERQEAAFIIEQANKKAKEIKTQLLKGKQNKDTEIHIQDQQQQQQKLLIQNQKDIEELQESNNKLTLSLEDLKDFSSKKITQEIKIPELNQNYKDLQDSRFNGAKDKEDVQNIVLEISFEEDDDDEFNNIIQSSKSQTNKINFEQKQKEENIQNDIKINKDLERSQEQTDILTQEIFNEIILRETEKSIQFAMEIHSRKQEVRSEINQNQVQQLSDKNQQDSLKVEEINKLANFSNEKFNQIIKPQPVLEASVKELTLDSKNKAQKKFGIDTSEESIEQYIDEISSQITMRREQFLQAFITPIYKNPLEVLANLQRPDFGDIDGNNFNNSLAYILNVQLYLTLEKARENLLSSSNEDELTDLISESQHIHNKVLFDCVNEALNSVRPYANQGEPMPWSRKPRKNLMFMFDSPENLDNILVDIKSRVMSWAKTKAGALPPKFSQTQDTATAIFQQYQSQMDEEQFAHQREKCLAQLLAQDVKQIMIQIIQLVEQEEKWLDYELEETQVKIDLSDIVLEHLVGETVEILSKIRGDTKTNTATKSTKNLNTLI